MVMINVTILKDEAISELRQNKVPEKAVDGWMGGWVDEWMGGWVDGEKSGNLKIKKIKLKRCN